MCQIVLLIFGIVYVFRIPKLIKMQPALGNDPELFWQWRAKELLGIYVFLAATWGSLILVVFIGVVMGVMAASRVGKIDDLVGPLTAINFVLFIPALIWAVVLSSQATKLKKQLTSNYLPPGYYPRAGQPTIQTPPPIDPARPAEDLAPDWTKPPEP